MSLRTEAEIAVQILAENDGFTLTKNLHIANGKAYFAAFEAYTQYVPLAQFTADSLIAFRRTNLQVLKSDPTNNVGGWLNQTTGEVELDISKAFQDFKEAVTFGQAEYQQAIWDGFKGEGYDMTMEEGSHLQRQTSRRLSSEEFHAKMKAMYTHVIYAPAFFEDDPTGVEGEEDTEENQLKGWRGLLPGWHNPLEGWGTSLQPAFPSGLSPTLAPAVSKATTSTGLNGERAMDDYSEVHNASVYKWIWSEQDGVLIWQPDDEGNPVHNQVAMQEWQRALTPKDVLGYATQEQNGLALDCWSTDPPPKAFQAVKQELLKFLPDAHVLLPADHAQPDAFGGPAPETLSHRTEAAVWAQRMFGDNLLPEVKQLKVGPYKALGIAYREAAMEADHEGAMISLYMPDDIAKAIAIKGGEPAEDLHITLAYFEDKAVDRDDWERAIEVARGVALQHEKLTGKISGIGVFHNEEDVLWASPSIPGLAEFRTAVVEAVEAAGFKVSDLYGYQPHCTLKYDFKGKPPRTDGQALSFDAAYFTVAQKRTELPFG